MGTATTSEINADTLVPDLVRERPQVRGVLDRYGLRGCGGRLGPYESVGFFARAHDVQVAQLIRELRDAVTEADSGETPERPADAIYRRFFMAGIAVVLTLGASWGAWLLLQIAWTGSFRAAGLHAINAHGHAQIFGWVGLFVMGFAYQAFPRFKHTDLRWPHLAFASWWLMVVGIVVRSLFEPLAATESTWVGLVLAAAAAEVLAIGLCVAVLLATWRRSSNPLVHYDAYIACALAWFLAQAVCDASYLAATLLTDGAAKTDIVATWQAPLRDMQIHGFAMLMILGVSQRLLHHVYGFQEGSRKLSLVLLPVLNLAVIGEALGLVFMRRIDPAFAALCYGSVIALTVSLIALVANWRLFGQTREIDRSLKFIRAAYVWLLISFGLMLLMPVYQLGLLPWLAPDGVAAATGFSHAYYGAIRHAITVGFISLMIVAVAARVVPTLNGLDGKTLPHLWLPFVLINTGCALRVFGQITTDITASAFPFAGASGILEVIGLAVWGAHLAGIMIGWTHANWANGRPSSATPVVRGEPLVGTQLVGEVLDVYPHLLNTFVGFGFRPLTSLFLRRRLAWTITIDRACRMLNVDAADLLNVLNGRLRKMTVPLAVVEAAPPAAASSTASPSCSCCADRAEASSQEKPVPH